MNQRAMFPVLLSDMQNGQEADLYALMTAKEELRTRDGKPYHKVAFRDSLREVSFPIWGDSPWAEECRRQWNPGTCYKLRAVYRESAYGPQLEIRKIREVTEGDAADGYDPAMFLPHSRFEPAAMFEQLLKLAQERIDDLALRDLTVAIIESHREQLLMFPAATYNHHAFCGGLLEHVLSVTRTVVFLADKYDEYYPDLRPRLNRGLAVAGAILHDIGKLRELETRPEGPCYTSSGQLVGHILQGRDIVREAAAGRALDAEVLLRLEHIIVSHQRLPEWGSPKPPMTPEALLVHYADDLDAKYYMVYAALRDDAPSEPLTGKKNVLHQHFFRGAV